MRKRLVVYEPTQTRIVIEVPCPFFACSGVFACDVQKSRRIRVNISLAWKGALL